INDAGNQVQLLAESVRARGLELEGKPATLPEEGYHGEYIKDIAKAYVAANPNGLDDRKAITVFALKSMIKEIEKDLADFGMRFDSWFSEASVVEKGLVDKHVQTLRQRGYVKDHEGAVWFVAPGEEDDPEKDPPTSASKVEGHAPTKEGSRDK